MAELHERVSSLEAELSQMKRMLEVMQHQKKSATPKEFEIEGQIFYRNGKPIHPKSKEGQALKMILDRQHGGKELTKEHQEFIDEVSKEIRK